MILNPCDNVCDHAEAWRGDQIILIIANIWWSCGSYYAIRWSIIAIIWWSSGSNYKPVWLCLWLCSGHRRCCDHQKIDDYCKIFWLLIETRIMKIYYSWFKVEILVCGSPTMDIAQLKKVFIPKLLNWFLPFKCTHSVLIFRSLSMMDTSQQTTQSPVFGRFTANY